MTDTSMAQRIEIKRTYFPTLGMCAHGLRVSRGTLPRVESPAAGATGGKIGDELSSSSIPRTHFTLHSVRSDFNFWR